MPKPLNLNHHDCVVWISHWCSCWGMLWMRVWSTKIRFQHVLGWCKSWKQSVSIELVTRVPYNSTYVVVFLVMCDVTTKVRLQKGSLQLNSLFSPQMILKKTKCSPADEDIICSYQNSHLLYPYPKDKKTMMMHTSTILSVMCIWLL